MSKYNDAVRSIEKIATSMKNDDYPNYMMTQIWADKLLEEIEELKKHMNMEDM